MTRNATAEKQAAAKEAAPPPSPMPPADMHIESEILVPEMVDWPRIDPEVIVGKSESPAKNKSSQETLDSAPGSSTDTRTMPVMQPRNPAQIHARQPGSAGSPGEKCIRSTTEDRMEVEDRMPARSRPLDLDGNMDVDVSEKRPRMLTVSNYKIG